MRFEYLDVCRASAHALFISVEVNFWLKRAAISANRFASSWETVLFGVCATTFRNSINSSNESSSSLDNRFAFRKLATTLGAGRCATPSPIIAVAAIRSVLSKIFQASITTPVGFARNASWSAAGTASPEAIEYRGLSSCTCSTSVSLLAAGCSFSGTLASALVSTSLNFAAKPPGSVSSANFGIRSMISFLKKPTINAAATGHAIAETSSAENLSKSDAFKSQNTAVVITGSAIDTFSSW